MVGFTGQELMQGLRAAEQGVKQGWSSQMSGKSASIQQPNEIGGMNGAVLGASQKPQFETRGNSKEQDMNEAPENDASANFGADLLVGGLLGQSAGTAMSTASAVESAKAPRRDEFVFKPAVAPRMQTDPRKQKPSSSYDMN